MVPRLNNAVSKTVFPYVQRTLLRKKFATVTTRTIRVSQREKVGTVNPASTDPKGAQQLPQPLFGPYLLWPNGRPSRQLLSSSCGVVQQWTRFQLAQLERR